MQELDIRTLLFTMLKHIKWIILATVVGAALFGAYTGILVDDTYSSQTKLYVNNYTDASGVSGASSSSILASQEMVKECIEVIKDDYVMSEVRLHLADLGYAMTNRQILAALSLSQQGETAVLHVQAVTTDPKLSRAICQSVYDVAPERLLEIIQIGSIKPMAPPTDGTKVGPSIPRNAIIGALLGFLLSVVAVLLVTLLDNTIKDEKDLKKHFDVVVLGIVPSFQENKKHKKSKKTYEVKKEEVGNG